MAGLLGQRNGYQPGAENTIRQFSVDRRLTIAEDDANGALLNEAVIAHLDSPDGADSNPGSSHDERIAAAILKRKMEELEVSRQKFLKHLSPQQKLYLEKAPNTTKAVLATIDSANFEWCRRRESGSGLVADLKKRFHQTCRGLDQHEKLLSMLPKEHEFVSVFYGAFNSIVAASVMNQTMADGLPKIVDELNAIVKSVAGHISQHPDVEQQMERVLMDLYIRVFELLAKLMEWYSKNNHGFKVLRKDCYKEFELELQSIRFWAETINKEVLTNLVVQVRQENRRILQEMKRAADSTENYFERQKKADIQRTVQREMAVLADPGVQRSELTELLLGKLGLEFRILGATQTATLTSMHAATAFMVVPFAPQATAGGERNMDSGHAESLEQPRESIVSSVETSLSEDSLSPKSSPPSGEAIEFESRFLDDWFPDDHVRPFQLSQGPPSQLPLHEPVAARLSQWVRGSDSQILCIQFPYNPGQVSIGGRLASYVISTALEAEHPIISYFCSLPREGVPEGRSMQTIALCEMVASLIRQMVALLPSTLPESAASLSKGRFESLDGTLRAWGPMLSILADLLSLLVAQDLLIVLHGLQWLDSEHSDAPIKELLDVVRAQIRGLENHSTGIVKALFVTEGQARAVVPWLKRGEHFICEENRRHGGW